MIREELKKFFQKLENDITPLNEHDLAEKLKIILDSKNTTITDKGEFAEFIGFNFIPSYVPRKTGWGIYYGPMFVLPNEQGMMVEFPSIEQVDLETIGYWRKRAEEATHPVLLNRYADLVFEFGSVKLNTNIDFLMAQKVIDSAIKLCELNLQDGLECKVKLKRALQIALQINDKVRIDSLKQAIIKTEKKYAQDDKPGLWGYAFKWLVLDNTERISLEEKEKNKLVFDLEDRLTRLASVENPDPWHVECIMTLLAPYYASKKNETSLKRILETCENSYRKNKYANSDGMLISNYLQKLIDIYLTYSNFDFAKHARSKILNELNNLSKNAKFSMSEVSTEINISDEEISDFLNKIFGPVTDRLSLEETLVNIAINFIVKKKNVIDQLSDLSNKHPLLYLVGHEMMSEDGYPVSKFGSLEEDYDKHLIESFSRNLHFGGIFLRYTLQKLKEVYTSEEIAIELFKSAVFHKEDKEYITKLFNALWSEDYLTVSCLSIPLIEDAIRNLYRVNNQTYIKPNEEGGYDVYSLNQLIENGLLRLVFRGLGEDVEYYFKVLLTERIGWNLRNNFAHGINKNSFQNEDVANRLIHVLFCLFLVRIASSEKQEN